MVDTYVLEKVQERLDLTDAQYAKLAPLISQQQANRRDLARRHFHALRQLRRLLASGAAREDRVLELLGEIKALERDGPRTRASDQQAIDDVLTPLQQAKYRVLAAEVERRLRALRHRGRDGLRPGRRRGRGPRDRGAERP
jgi:Spy/CpxP family protein refolding chaperone